MEAHKRLRRSVGFAFITDEWRVDLDDPPEDIGDAVRQLAGGPEPKTSGSPERTSIHGALLGNVHGPVVLYKTRREAPTSGDDFIAELDDFIELVDYGDLSEFGGDKLSQLGEISGIGELIDKGKGDRPDWVDEWVEDLGGGQLGPRTPDRGQGRPGVQGSGRRRDHGPPSGTGGTSELGSGQEKERDRLKDEWGVGEPPSQRFGPHASGLRYDSDALGIGWGSDDAQQESPPSTTPAQPDSTAVDVLGGAVILVLVAAVAPNIYVRAAAGGMAIGCVLAVWQASHSNEQQKKTPDPEAEGTSKAPKGPLRPHLRGETVFGGPWGGDRRRPRVRIEGEWNAGTSYGWITYGAPRAREVLLPADSAMPSDTSDENPTIWLGATTTTHAHASADEDWIVARGHWAWSRFGAPRARGARHN